MSKCLRIKIERFDWADDDPLATEHRLIERLISSIDSEHWNYGSVDFKSSEPGQEILALKAPAMARLVSALVKHAVYWDGLVHNLRALADDTERTHLYHAPEWEHIWPYRLVCVDALKQVMRRKLPLSRETLVELSDWIVSQERVDEMLHPLKAFVKAIERFGHVSLEDERTHASLSRLVKALKVSREKNGLQWARRVEEQLELLATDKKDSTAVAPRCVKPFVAPVPAPLGHPGILVPLKQYLGIADAKESIDSQVTGLDGFALRADSALRDEHEQIDCLLPEVVGRPGYHDPDLSQTETGLAMLTASPSKRARLLLALAERCVSANMESKHVEEGHGGWQSLHVVQSAFQSMTQTELEFEREGLFDLLLYISAAGDDRWINTPLIDACLTSVADHKVKAELKNGERYVLHRLRYRMVFACPFGRPTDDVLRLNHLLDDNPFLALVPGEAWSDAINHDLGEMESGVRAPWVELLEHAASAKGARPSSRWSNTAQAMLASVSPEKFATALLKWLPLVDAPRTIRVLRQRWDARDLNRMIQDENADCLRGLLWLSHEVTDKELVRAVGAVAVSCYRKIPGVGPRAVKVGNAAVYALSLMKDPLALGSLAFLKAKVKFGSAQKEIEKAFNLAAERSGLPREELEEMAVPTYGLTDIGICEEMMGDFTARLAITSVSSTELTWVTADGKIQRSVPAAVKKSHAEDLKELKAAAKDIQQMLPAQRERIDSLFLQQKTWTLEVWRERYLNHPLVGYFARRLLWEFTTGEITTTGIWFNGELVGIDLKPLTDCDETTTVSLWHPIGKELTEITAWRDWLDSQQIQQPFKQAHREVYLQTDAERSTEIYSNRYAGHVIRQHQFNVLATLRGWKNQLRLMVDDWFPPASLSLPQWGLRAEYWIEGAGAEYGIDTNETGTYLHLTTDQVRFYAVDADKPYAHATGGGYQQGGDKPIPLEQIPPLVFSEVMRDVDLFVGVASVGNDPTWADGGPDGQYRDYWHEYSFGELGASAKTRREVLERLVPKLKIAKQCSFQERFLVVEGKLRTYKIHLGSGNILMKPNDQYLCIVPNQGKSKAANNVFLPFEGDLTLSVILSKAFLLAADDKIKDMSIVNQIKG